MGKIRPIVTGFTLIELMLVVAIIGLLSAIALPKFANLVNRSKEASIKGNLGVLRSAMSLYYADNEGWVPRVSSPGDFYVEKYIDSVPLPTLPGHRSPMANMLMVTNSTDCARMTFDPAYTAGSWQFCSPRILIFISCNHTDSKGIWISEW
ncbi:MAG TPA: prepilin-type N-terminal cleavage/methylation domain-containing protein [Elusimicrobiota bacterium]|jgi:prepilin-type N-terminal cleavage/methylation domain-containing protein|nr:prepilin-type N-terminal cleavage/methylation domain-containing protein [Elusimicrobiota bacterium]HMX44129.1 prepilin-type N-terminal cleavage/methylation domain-containing protein [Elusimicrobiota bacterium]HMX93892.1 prepilin-type N-terminal cleavage/methylation domain-containing protein [Elusimicrobiota bacterium]HMZ25940.1 prepilin-type N-terminal cleavage/methylation domain-containing protein [Elusimicrobiota bacterium]HNA61016.1 prepilin-type N-terminal cleavage/methylation domain-con